MASGYGSLPSTTSSMQRKLDMLASALGRSVSLDVVPRPARDLDDVEQVEFGELM